MTINIDSGKKLNEGQGGKVALKDLSDLERNINNAFLPVSFLHKGNVVQKCVCLIKRGNMTATGFLIKRDLVLTNHHVFPDAAAVVGAKVIFGFDEQGDPATHVQIASFEYSYQPLDFAVIKLEKSMPGDYIDLPQHGINYAVNQHANVIGHPLGGPKAVSIRSNLITEVTENTIEYTSDTEPGSSGSPVFDNSWSLIALHSGAGTKDPNSGKYITNKGVRIDAIVKLWNQQQH